MMRVFVSQPMRDKTNEEIKKERREAIERVRKEVGEDVEVIDSFLKTRRMMQNRCGSSESHSSCSARPM